MGTGTLDYRITALPDYCITVFSIVCTPCGTFIGNSEARSDNQSLTVFTEYLSTLPAVKSEDVAGDARPHWDSARATHLDQRIRKPITLGTLRYSAQTTWKIQLISSAGRCEEHIDCIVRSISRGPYQNFSFISVRPLDDCALDTLYYNRLLHLCFDLIIQFCERYKINHLGSRFKKEIKFGGVTSFIAG